MSKSTNIIHLRLREKESETERETNREEEKTEVYPVTVPIELERVSYHRLKRTLFVKFSKTVFDVQ